MALKDITRKEVKAAIKEFDEIGSKAFQKYPVTKGLEVR